MSGNAQVFTEMATGRDISPVIGLQCRDSGLETPLNMSMSHITPFTHYKTHGTIRLLYQPELETALLAVHQPL